MFKIIDNKILITRGDEGKIPFQIPINEEETEFYQFQVGDKVTFGVYEERGLDKNAVILKEVEVTEPANIVYIPLNSDDTRFGKYINQPKTYWYEISLNNKETPICFDDDGEKIFELYPEGKGKDVS